jgi:uncharacterized membrane protein YozB (DUF420 family)
MEHLNLRLYQLSWAIVAFSRWLILACVIVFVTYVGLRGTSEAWDNDGFPEVLAVKLELMPYLFPLHMITGGLALLLVPATIYFRHTRFHRLLGRTATADILVAGITAIPVALQAPTTPISAWGFTAQAVTWLILLGFGIWNIKRGRVAAHRACMLMLAAVTSGALFFRIYLALSKLFVPFKYFYVFYAVDAWIAWSIPLVAMAWWLGLKNASAQPSHNL